LGGDTRYETSVTIANWATDATARIASELLSYDNLAIARGDNHADALSGGVLQGFSSSVILLTGNGNRTQAKAVISAQATGITEIRFFGGPAAIDVDTIADYIKAIPHDVINWVIPGTEIAGVN
jgi:hypothetical protein